MSKTMCDQCGRPLVEIDNYGERLQDRAARSLGMPHRASNGALPPRRSHGPHFCLGERSSQQGADQLRQYRRDAVSRQRDGD